MKRWHILNTIFIAGIIVFLAYHLITKDRIVYVDSLKLTQEYSKKNEVGKEYGLKLKEWNARLDTMETELESMMSEFEQNKHNLNTKDTEKKLREIGTKRQQFEDFKNYANKKSKEEGEKLTKEVAEKINNLIYDYGKEHNYDIIIGANGRGTVLYGNDKHDITDELIEYINNE